MVGPSPVDDLVRAHLLFPSHYLTNCQSVGPVVGIDLGTSNPCVSIMEGKTSCVIENAEGAQTTLSVIAFSKHGECLVGLPVKRRAIVNVMNNVFAFIGQKFDDEEVKEDVVHW
jgi:molecular chaperone DnaK